MFAALSTIEPTIVEREVVLYLEREESWFNQRLALVEDRIRAKLADLSRRLGDAEWLDDEFSAGDLMTADVLRRLGGSGLLEEFSNLAAFVARAEARPAFTRAFDAQRRFFISASAE
jgi:glutathione S-transferase